MKLRENQQIFDGIKLNSDEDFKDFKFNPLTYRRILKNTIFTETFDKLLVLGIQVHGFGNWP